MMLTKMKGSDKSSGNEDGLATTHGTSLSSIPSLTLIGSFCDTIGVTRANRRIFKVAFVIIFVDPSSS
jgi:hypothetical protein